MGASSLVRKRKVKKHLHFHSSMVIVQMFPVYLLLNALVEHTWLSLFSLYHLDRCSLAIPEASTAHPAHTLIKRFTRGKGGSSVHRCLWDWSSALPCPGECQGDIASPAVNTTLYNSRLRRQRQGISWAGWLAKVVIPVSSGFN